MHASNRQEQVLAHKLTQRTAGRATGLRQGLRIEVQVATGPRPAPPTALGAAELLRAGAETGLATAARLAAGVHPAAQARSVAPPVAGVPHGPAAQEALPAWEAPAAAVAPGAAAGGGGKI